MNPDSLLSLAELDIAAVEPAWEESAGVIYVVYGVLISAGILVDALLIARLPAILGAWGPYARRLEWRPWGWGEASKVVLFAVAAFVVALMVLLSVDRVARGFLQQHETLAIALQSALIHWPVLLFLGWRLSRRGLSWRNAFWMRGRSWWKDIGLGVGLYVAVLPVIAAASWMYHMLLHAIGYDTSLQDVALALTEEASPFVRVYLLLLTVLLAPLFEELLFRGIALPALAKRWGLVRAVVVLSLVFALVHQHVPSLVALALLSAGLCLAYIRTGSLIVPVVMHGLFNAVNLGLLLYVRHGG